MLGAKAATLGAKAFGVATNQDRPILSAVTDGALSSQMTKKAMGQIALFTLKNMEKAQSQSFDSHYAEDLTGPSLISSLLGPMAQVSPSLPFGVLSPSIQSQGLVHIRNVDFPRLNDDVNNQLQNLAKNVKNQK
eukprot:Gregarina_sp_Poly_1__98@NODE_1020_length_5329_cov_521_329913_g711_i0_p5_GENE_NODE_1020_length_5329_cov_521_329913_g711_i0NODE_1020_length_5329_cov_521_329913_g711_i0_p5_ORF_typecomplete_len134_score24_19_NODE_1020_length_5329_cov_521_329913_g711_i016102011